MKTPEPVVVIGQQLAVAIDPAPENLIVVVSEPVPVAGGQGTGTGIAKISADPGNDLTLGTDGGIFYQAEIDADLADYYTRAKNGEPAEIPQDELDSELVNAYLTARGTTL